jgi:hypothetical protein
MEGDEFGDLGNNSIPDHFSDEHETLLIPRPEGLPSPVETALAQYADSIERLSASESTETDPYTRGFIAGLRAAIKVAANVIRP